MGQAFDGRVLVPSRSGKLCGDASDGAAEIGDRLLLPNEGKPSELLWGLVFLGGERLFLRLSRFTFHVSRVNLLLS